MVRLIRRALALARTSPTFDLSLDWKAGSVYGCVVHTHSEDGQRGMSLEKGVPVTPPFSRRGTPPLSV